MSRRPSRERYEDDYEWPHTPGDRAAAIVILVIVGGLLLVTVVGCVGFFWLGARGVQRAADEQAARNAAERAKEAALPTRAEFEKSVIGKSKDEVIARLGRPSSTTGAANDSWTYLKQTRDLVAGKVDDIVWIWFNEQGVAVRVSY
jgi:hypothetical protein